jgi:AcrR family transcriptional regulator
VESDQPRRGRPRGSTRERILDIALALFNEQGYDKTSLRDISEQLGVTKAALYHHFQRKEDILLELHLRLHALGHRVVGRLGQLNTEHAAIEEWAELLDEFIDQVQANRELFVLHQRNHSALEELEHSDRHKAEHDDLEQMLRRFLSDPSLPLTLRVRLACSIGAVAGALMGGADMFAGAPSEEVARAVRDVVHGIFRGAESPTLPGTTNSR